MSKYNDTAFDYLNCAQVCTDYVHARIYIVEGNCSVPHNDYIYPMGGCANLKESNGSQSISCTDSMFH